MDREIALFIRGNSLFAIEKLTEILFAAQGRVSDKEFEVLMKACGLSIGNIQTGPLDLVAKDYPDSDDLDK